MRIQVRNVLIVILGLLALGASFLYANRPLTFTKHNTVFYYAGQATYLLALVIVPVAIIVVVGGAVDTVVKRRGTIVPALLSIVILLFANGMACEASFL